MFELMIGIDGVQRRTNERLERRRRGDDGERSRLRRVLAARSARTARPRCEHPLAQSR